MNILSNFVCVCVGGEGGPRSGGGSLVDRATNHMLVSKFKACNIYIYILEKWQWCVTSGKSDVASDRDGANCVLNFILINLWLLSLSMQTEIF